jgi:hypothetical protein
MSSAKTCIYKVWKDSVRVVPFPFQFTDKTEGKIVQTWSDVKDGLNRDAINSALAFATGHFTPTSPQSAIMRETMEKEEKRRRKTLLGQTASSRPTTNETATDRLGTASTNYSRPTGAASVPLSTTTAAGTNASDAASANRERRRSKVRGAPPTEEEKALLLQSEGGGRGRIAFLKARRNKTIQERFGGQPQTTSHMYGWDAKPSVLKRIGAGPRDGPKKVGLSSWMRGRGVFAADEFVKPIRSIE